LANPATRLITLIQLLERQPGQKAADLARELGISIRSLHRYFGRLDELGIPVYSERGPYGGFSLVRGYRMPPLVFTPEEAVALSLGANLVEEMWGQVYRPAARSGFVKLENVLPDEQRQEVAWARRTFFTTGLNRADLEAQVPALDLLRRAAREHRRVRIVYRGGSQGTASPRLLDPYALVHRWGWWYAIGYCHRRQAVRTFRVDRMSKLTLLEVPFDPPEGFDIRAYLDREPQIQARVFAQLRFAPDGARIAHENRTYWESLEETSDGAVTVTFPAPSLEWAASTALAYGPLVEVLGPPELVALVRRWAEAVVAQTSSKSGPPRRGGRKSASSAWKH